MNLPKEEIDQIFKEYIQFIQIQESSEIFNVFLLFATRRLLYHFAKYCHHILISQKDSISDYLRIRILWRIMYITYDSRKNFILKALIKMLKICTATLLIYASPEKSLIIHNFCSYVYGLVDLIFDPFEMFLNAICLHEPKRELVFKKILRKNQKILDDIEWLVNENIFQNDNKILAENLLRYQNNLQKLQKLIYKENWGDVNKSTIRTILPSKKEPNLSALIQKDIDDLNLITPRKPPKRFQ